MQQSILTNTPEAGRITTRTSCYVDADNAANRVTRRSHSGNLIRCMNTPIIWFGKRKYRQYLELQIGVCSIKDSNGIDRSLTVQIKDVWCIPIEGPTYVFCDNKSVATKTSTSTPMLSKKYNEIFYYCVWEAQASGAQTMGWIHGEYNQAGLFTKTTLSTEVKNNVCHEIYGWRRKDIYKYTKIFCYKSRYSL